MIDVGRVGVEGGADPPVGGLEDVDRLLRELRFGWPFEQDREVVAELSARSGRGAPLPCATPPAVRSIDDAPGAWTSAFS